MSCSLYRYSEKCDGRPCVGDCDLCDFDPEETEEKEDVGKIAIMYGDFVKAPRKDGEDGK